MKNESLRLIKKFLRFAKYHLLPLVDVRLQKPMNLGGIQDSRLTNKVTISQLFIGCTITGAQWTRAPEADYSLDIDFWILNFDTIMCQKPQISPKNILEPSKHELSFKTASCWFKSMQRTFQLHMSTAVAAFQLYTIIFLLWKLKWLKILSEYVNISHWLVLVNLNIITLIHAINLKCCYWIMLITCHTYNERGAILKFSERLRGIKMQSFAFYVWRYFMIYHSAISKFQNQKQNAISKFQNFQKRIYKPL